MHASRFLKKMRSIRFTRFDSTCVRSCTLAVWLYFVASRLAGNASINFKFQQGSQEGYGIYVFNSNQTVIEASAVPPKVRPLPAKATKGGFAKVWALSKTVDPKTTANMPLPISPISERLWQASESAIIWIIMRIASKMQASPSNHSGVFIHRSLATIHPARDIESYTIVRLQEKMNPFHRVPRRPFSTVYSTEPSASIVADKLWVQKWKKQCAEKERQRKDHRNCWE